MNNVTIIKWHDNRCVHVISSYKGVNPIEKAKRWSSKDKKYIEVDMPSAIKEYNTKMGGVDLTDMLIELYRIDNKCK